MKLGTPKKSNASYQRVSDLIFKARQFKMWSELPGRPSNERAVHLRKSKQIEKSLRSLGYEGEIFD